MKQPARTVLLAKAGQNKFKNKVTRRQQANVCISRCRRTNMTTVTIEPCSLRHANCNTVAAGRLDPGSHLRIPLLLCWRRRQISIMQCSKGVTQDVRVPL